MGLVEVAYQLRRVNHHLKVFAAVRKEAFAKFDDTTSMVQQYRGSTVDIAYSPASLREIFVNNIRREKERNLVARRAAARRSADGVPRLAPASRTATPASAEDVFEYIYRHTLRRPRDLMTIGQKLSDLAARGARKEERLKVAVNQAATEIARGVPERDLALHRRRRPAARARPAAAATCCAGGRRARLARPTTRSPPEGGQSDGTCLSLCIEAGLLGWVHATWSPVPRCSASSCRGRAHSIRPGAPRIVALSGASGPLRHRVAPQCWYARTSTS